MITIAGLILFLIFLVLSMMHFYWGFGGKKSMDAVVPKGIDGTNLFNPGFLASILVAIGLFGFALFVLIKINLLDIHLPPWILKYGLIAISILFFIRAIGDFKYIGFFARMNSAKTGKPSRFALLDKKYYSPLCLLIGILAILIESLQ
jgi:glucan phosphoethanolaminetransferase (alkaline phosphatase superfamily)